MNLDDATGSRAAAFTRTQVAALLDVDERTVTRAIDEGQLPAIRLGRRVLIPRLPLLALLGADPDTSEAGPASPAIAATHNSNDDGAATDVSPRGPLGLAG